jgi:hypothetical protein
MGTTGRCKRRVRVVVGSHMRLGGVFSQGKALLPHTKSLPSTVVAKCNFFSSILIEVSLGGVFSMCW